MIWHTANQKPKPNKMILVKYSNVDFYGVYGTMPGTEIVPNCSRWCYLDELFAQVEKTDQLQNQNSVLLNYLMDFMHREKEYVARYKTENSVSRINRYHNRIKDHLHEIGIDD